MYIRSTLTSRVKSQGCKDPVGVVCPYKSLIDHYFVRVGRINGRMEKEVSSEPRGGGRLRFTEVTNL